MLQRCRIQPRPDALRRVQEQGLAFHTDADGSRYWREDAYYRFLASEIDLIEDAADELARISLLAVDHVVRTGRWDDMAIPPWMRPAIEASWYAQDPSLYGRFDLAYDGLGPPKLLEYNADTPTSLFEASIIQHVWREDQFPNADQFNGLHEALVDRFREIARLRGLTRVHFACLTDHLEDTITTSYLADLWAEASGRDAHEVAAVLDMGALAWSDGEGGFRDARSGEPIHALFKLYPWEWLAKEQSQISDDPQMWARARASTILIEPAWKMVLANKGILAILWELFPGHPNLLPATRYAPQGVDSWVRKPLYSREGANISIVENGFEVASTGGTYGAEGTVWQALASLPNCDGWYPVLGAWIVGDKAAGLGIRESASRITDNTSAFVPHMFA